jgi:hypothetical protein
MDTYEKKYNEAIKRAKQHCADYVVETIFPELKESENKKPNGAIVMEDFNEGNGFYKVNLAYLNKEQVEDIENIIKRWNVQKYDEEAIRDCIGVILTDAPEQRFVDFNTSLKDCLAWLEKRGEQQDINPSEYINDMEGNGCYLKNATQKPADKVEPKFKVKFAGSEYNVLGVRDIAGVTFYVIEDEPNHIDYILPNTCEIVSQKPAWSEEDKNMLQSILDEYKSMQIEKRTWLKSLKDRIQPKQEWSEEDEKIIIQIKDAVENYFPTPVADKIKSWLKSLKERYTWKPSDEQMDALLVKIPIEDSCNKVDNILKSLYSDLKKLK